MVTWIVVGVLLFGLLILVLAARSVLVRLPRLRRAVLLMLRRQADAEALQAALLVTQKRALALQDRAGRAQRAATLIRERRASD